MSDRSSLQERLVGTRDRLGWWTLPIFVMVGLAGAVFAGALAAVYYGQQVDGLQEETAEGRAELRSAVDDVESAGQEALDAIEQEVESVRETLTRELPFEDVASVGVVALRATIGASASAQQPAPPPGGADQPSGALAAQEQQPPSPPPSSPSPAPTSPSSRPTEQRVASGFAVATDGATAFIATTYALVADPSAPGGVVGQVEVITPAGSVTGVTHSWDAGRDLALIRADLGGVELLEWRPSSEDLAVGERVIAAGVTPTLDSVQIPAQVAFSDVTVLITDLPAIEFLRGAPIVDGDGFVVGIVSGSYAPFGPEAGRGQAMVPVRLLCERMLRNCDALEAQPDEG